LLVGSSGSGKTTLLLSLIEHVGADYVVNDHVLLSGEPTSVGCFPLPLRIGWGSASASARLRDMDEVRSWAAAHEEEANANYASDWGASGKLDLSPAKLARAFGCSIRGRATLAAVVLPTIHAAPMPLLLERAPAHEIEAALRAGCYTPHDKRWKRPWIQPRDTPDAELEARAHALLHDVAQKIAGYRLTFGTDLGARLARDDAARRELAEMLRR
jgi:ABC-type dipeptide/oligopeptide/nickel transport system ATPase component